MNEASQSIAIWAAGLFSGAALYITLVEHPARMQCGTLLAATEFGPSYGRAAVMQAALAVVGTLAGTGAGLTGGGLHEVRTVLSLGAFIVFVLAAYRSRA